MIYFSKGTGCNLVANGKQNTFDFWNIFVHRIGILSLLRGIERDIWQLEWWRWESASVKILFIYPRGAEPL